MCDKNEICSADFGLDPHPQGQNPPLLQISSPFSEKSAVHDFVFAVQILAFFGKIRSADFDFCSANFSLDLRCKVWFLQCQFCVFAEGESGHAKQTHTTHGADKTRIPQKHAQKIPPEISDKLGFMENPKTGVFLDPHPLDPHPQESDFKIVSLGKNEEHRLFH